MKYLFFDFDGTIANTEEGILKALKFMANKLDMRILPDSTYRKFIGPTLTYSLKKYYPEFPSERYNEAIKVYQSYYNTTGAFQLSIYPQMKKTLKLLSDDRYKLFISSVKPESLIKQLIPRLELEPYFSGYYGASEDEITRTKKADILKYGLEKSNAISQESVMIGDRLTDMEGGLANKVHTLGVTYGFGDKQELIDSGAEYIVDKVTDIPSGINQFK